MKKAILMNELDNVATVLSDLNKNDEVEVVTSEKRAVTVLTVLNTIPFGHKIALVDIDNEEDVTKYGERVGYTSSSIVKGEHVHIHNVISSLGKASSNCGKEKKI